MSEFDLDDPDYWKKQIVCECGNESFTIEETTPIGPWVQGRYLLHCTRCNKITEETVVD